jgi:carbonic anhydrase/acetyltransferase-like protein (isoleucine patch superfamily)
MARRIPGDWFDGSLPDNVVLDETAYLETAFYFADYRSQAEIGARFGRGASIYGGTMFEVGPKGQLEVGAFTLLNGVRIICEAQVEIGSHCLISWNTVLMDSYRILTSAEDRRRCLKLFVRQAARTWTCPAPACPVRLENNVWIGFGSCVLPGVTIGEGSVVGARSVVVEDVPPYVVVAGNPAHVIRQLSPTAKEP